MTHRVLDRITAGPYWIWKSWLVVMIAAGLFSCAPAILFYRPLALPPAYQLKSEQPLADTALLRIPEDPGERSHGAKLTPRVFSSVMLFVASKLSFHPYAAATAGGFLFWLSGIVVGYRVTSDRVSALMIGLVLAGLYATNACFSMNFEPKPFDGIALGMVALTMMLIDRPWLLAASAYLTCWTDERVILSLGLVAITVIVIGDIDSATKRIRCAILAAAVVAYVFSRSVLAGAMGWSPSDTSMLAENLLGAFTFSQLAAWTCFEGGWIAIAMGLWAGWRNHSVLDCLLIASAAMASIASCLIVLDVSRAAAFAFPLILAAFAVLAKEPDQDAGTIRRAATLAAVISLISTNFEVIAWTVVQPLPSTPIAIFSQWMNV